LTTLAPPLSLACLLLQRPFDTIRGGIVVRRFLVVLETDKPNLYLDRRPQPLQNGPSWGIDNSAPGNARCGETGLDHSARRSDWTDPMDLSLTDPQLWASLLTLTLLEIILGIDNIIFLAIITEKLPPATARAARAIGISLALAFRLALLAAIVWIVGLAEPVFQIFGHPVSWRDLILIGGGLFLLWKGTTEIHKSVESDPRGADAAVARGMGAAIAQIVAIDIIFSLDSVVTAVGMTDQLPVMYAAVLIAMGVMLAASGPVAGFVSRNPTVKMLALSFLLLIGLALVADGLGFHIPKGYLYFAVAFSLAVEALNLFAQRRRRTAKAADPDHE